METEGDLTLDEHNIQYTDDVLYNCILETYIILLTNDFPITFFFNYRDYIDEE